MDESLGNRLFEVDFKGETITVSDLGKELAAIRGHFILVKRRNGKIDETSGEFVEHICVLEYPYSIIFAEMLKRRFSNPETTPIIEIRGEP